MIHTMESDSEVGYTPQIFLTFEYLGEIETEYKNKLQYSLFKSGAQMGSNHEKIEVLNLLLIGSKHISRSKDTVEKR